MKIFRFTLYPPSATLYLVKGKCPEAERKEEGMEYLYDYMDSSGNIYVVVQDDNNNILTLTADEYNERVHQDSNRRKSL